MKKRNLPFIGKKDMICILVDALEFLQGKGTIVQVSKVIWENYNKELKSSGDIFYTWQYDMRWARHKLQKEGKLDTHMVNGRSIWELIK
tara:strand:+ start:323 stop:589 length:267 start_codon:yes stop_codon:yes gene_type:complete